MSDRIKVEGVGVRTDFVIPETAPNPLNRPQISYKKPIIALVIFVLVFIGMLFVSWIAAVAWTAVFFIVISKRAVIFLIHLYQNKAPDSVRLRCVFEPSCSEYALLAIEKYGLIVGGFKAVGRLRRCHFPNRGRDYP